MSQITVVDSLMGSGKTSWAIEYMNQNLDENILYVSPFLDQDDRIISACRYTRDFKKPINKGGGKLKSINKLFKGMSDIASTHELFKHLDDESHKNIIDGQYTLILDEVLNVVQKYDTQKNDIDILLESGCITIENYFVKWNPEKKDYDSKYNEIKELAESNSLMCINDTTLIWRYPPEIFSIFKKVYILTYLFEASILKYYFDMNNISYDKKGIMQIRMTTTQSSNIDCSYELCDYYIPNTSHFSQLIHIYEGKLNDSWIQKSTSLSLTWFSDPSNKSHIKQLKNNIYNYLRNIMDAKSETIMWTTFKDYVSKLKGKGYSSRFVSFNCRSTNDYAETYNLVYAVNVFVNPSIIHYFEQRNIKIDKDLYALSEMLQWIWRSRIRNGQDINIYIPSKRMRELLQKWISGEIYNEIQ